MYYDEVTEEFVVSNNTVRVALTGVPVDQIDIDHGGLQTGIIKIL